MSVVYSPLCVDLDGTLIRNDVTLLNFKLFAKRYPYLFFMPAVWILRGRAYMKAKLADLARVDPSMLPYNQPFLKFLKEQKQQGASLYLVTACDQKIAHDVADYLGIFDDVMASNGRLNLRQKAKAQALIQRFGDKQFTYAGNSYDDIYVWQHSQHCIAVQLTKKAQSHLTFKPDVIFD